jgi:hypothetical protein
MESSMNTPHLGYPHKNVMMKILFIIIGDFHIDTNGVSTLIFVKDFLGLHFFKMKKN